VTRASDAAREAATERLKAAYVRGTLNLEEFHGRVSNALVAPTVADLARLTSDVAGDTRTLPPVPPSPPPAVWPTNSRRKRVWIAALLIGAVAGGSATTLVNHERNNVPSHCLVARNNGQFYRLC
jgi:hypothetical protein